MGNLSFVMIKFMIDLSIDHVPAYGHVIDKCTDDRKLNQMHEQLSCFCGRLHIVINVGRIDGCNLSDLLMIHARSHNRKGEGFPGYNQACFFLNYILNKIIYELNINVVHIGKGRLFRFSAS